MSKMISIVGVNDISIQLHNCIKGSLLIGPYKEKLSSQHRNESITYMTIPYVIPKTTKILVDLTFSRITSLLINDFSLKENKKLTWVGYYQNGIVVKNVSKYGCVRCLYENSETLSNYFVVKSLLKDPKVLIETIIASIEENKSYRIYSDKTEEINIKKGCQSCVNGNYSFLENEYGEIVNENCNDNSVAVFPIDDRSINIRFLKDVLLKNEVEILEDSDEYIVFIAEGKKMFLFQNGRLMISDKISKEEAEYLYRKYVGS